MSRPNSKKDKIYAELIIAGLLTYITWTTDTLERPIIQNFTWRPLKDDHGFRFKVTPDVIIDIIRACNQIPHFRQLENKNLTVFTTCGTTAVKKRGKSESLYDNIRDAISTLHKYNLIQEKQERKQGYSCQLRDFTIKLPYPITNQNQLKTYLQQLFGTGKDWDIAADEYKRKSKFKKLGAVESETIDPNLSIIQTGIKGICQEIVQVAQKLPSELTAYTLEYRTHLQTVIPFLEQALVLSSVIPSQEYSKLILSATRIYVANGEYERGKCLLQKSLASSNIEQDIIMADSQHLLGNIYFQKGEYIEAKKYYLQSYNLRIKILGQQHSDVADSSEAIARLYNSWGLLEESEKWYLNTKNLQKDIYGINHVLFAHSLNGLANLYIKMQRFQEAEDYYNEAIEILTKQSESDPYPYLTDSQHGLANLYIRKKEYQKAEELHKYAIDLIESKEGSEHHRLITHWASLAVVYCFQYKVKQAINLYRKCINKSIKIYGNDHPFVGIYRSDLAWIFSKNCHYQKRALILFNSSINILTKTCTENHPNLINAKKGLKNILEITNNSNQK